MAAVTLLRLVVILCSRPYLGNHTVDALFFVLSYRPISTGQLRALLHFHIRPINPVVYWEPLGVNPMETSS